MKTGRMAAMALCGCGALMAMEMMDPVVMENRYVKLTVDRKRGATLRSMVDKLHGNAEASREFLREQLPSGGLAEDRLAGHGYPGKLVYQHYSGEVKRKGTVQTLTLTCRPTLDEFKGMAFAKTFVLRDDVRHVEVQWEIQNVGTGMLNLTPWVHNIVTDDYKDTLLPKASGVAQIKPSADYFMEPIRNWLAGYDGTTHRMIYFSTPHAQLLKHYYCYWNGYHAMEWTFKPTSLKPGERWHGVYRIGLAEPVTVPTAISDSGVLSYLWQGADLKVELIPTETLGAVTVQYLADGKVIARQEADYTVGAAPVVQVLPGTQLAAAKQVEVKILKNGKELPQLDSGRERQFVFQVSDKRLAVTENPLVKWDDGGSPYKEIEPSVLTAKLLKEQSCFVVGEVSPLVRVFQEDVLKAGAVQREHRMLRNCRDAWQVVVRNASKRPLNLQVVPESLALRCGASSLKVSARLVEYVESKTPSGFNVSLPVGWYPDPLLPWEGVKTVQGGRNQAIWLEVLAGADTPAGRYEGAVRLLVNGEAVECPLACQVLDRELPTATTLMSTVGCWWVDAKVLKEVGWNKEGGAFHKLSREILLKNRLTPRENGMSWTLDVAQEKQLAELKALNVSTISIPWWLAKDEKKLDKAVALLKKFGLFDKAFIYTIDEAPTSKFPEIVETSTKFHERHPGLKILGTIYEKDVSQLYGHVNIWCRGALEKDPWHDERRKAGDQFLTSNLPYSCLEDASELMVGQFWQMKRHDCDGFLFWNVIAGYGKSNPWKDISCAGLNGNAHLLYPHASGPVETQRFRFISMGAELFDLMSLAEKVNPQAYKELLKAFPEEPDQGQLNELKAKIMDILSEK